MTFIVFLLVFACLISLQLDKVELQKRIEELESNQALMAELSDITVDILKHLVTDSHPPQEINPRVDARLVHHGLITES